MRKWIIFLSVCAAVCRMAVEAGAAPAADDVSADEIARVHFCGTIKSSADPLSASFTAVSRLPASVEWRERTIDKLSTAPYRLLQTKLANGCTNDFSKELRPLITDMFQYESFIEALDSSNNVPEVLIALRLPKDRAAAWQAGLFTILSTWTGMTPAPVSGPGFSGWRLRKHLPPDTVVCLQSGEWLMFGWGDGVVRLQQTFLARIALQKSPAPALNEYWLEAWFDMARILARHPNPKITALLGAKAPRLSLLVKGGTNYIRPELNLIYDHPLAIRLEPWNIPTNMIQNSFTSFSAARGVQGWLAGLSFVSAMQLPSIPNQFSSWARFGMPLEHNLAFPVPAASNFLSAAEGNITRAINTQVFGDSPAVQAIWLTNRIILSNFPLAGFYVKAVGPNNGDFILTGLFPLAGSRVPKPVPGELLRQLYSKSDLIGYTWEVTDSRAVQWRSVIGLNGMLHGLPGPTPNSPGQTWIEQTHTNLGPCATEFTWAAPNQIKILRNATVGLSGLELNLLEYWLDAPSFPFAPEYPKRVFRKGPPGRSAPNAPLGLVPLNPQGH